MCFMRSVLVSGYRLYCTRSSSSALVVHDLVLNFDVHTFIAWIEGKVVPNGEWYRTKCIQFGPVRSLHDRNRRKIMEISFFLSKCNSIEPRTMYGILVVFVCVKRRRLKCMHICNMWGCRAPLKQWKLPKRYFHWKCTELKRLFNVCVICFVSKTAIFQHAVFSIWLDPSTNKV